jgi:hypothetical protein
MKANTIVMIVLMCFVAVMSGFFIYGSQVTGTQTGCLVVKSYVNWGATYASADVLCGAGTKVITNVSANEPVAGQLPTGCQMRVGDIVSIKTTRLFGSVAIEDNNC